MTNSTTLSRNKQSVNKYYIALDRDDLESVFSLFSTDIDYNRCGFKIEGIGALKSFFLNERTMRGVHEVKNMIAEDNKVASSGIFNGENAQGNAVILQFCEFYFFDDNGLINKRNSYLAMGVEATK